MSDGNDSNPHKKRKSYIQKRENSPILPQFTNIDGRKMLDHSLEEELKDKFTPSTPPTRQA